MTVLGYNDYGPDELYDADVVVVGTGAGGAVVGAHLAEDGRDVVFAEEGSYHPTESFNPYITESVPRLYRDVSATVIYGRPPIPYVEGRCVGGSTTINGGMTWRPPDHVLQDWERITGQPDLGLKCLEPFLESVEIAISAAPQHPESIGGDNRLMQQGAAKLGWKYEPNHRAQSHCVGTDNCILGCPTGAKQSTLVSYMPRALSRGARCLTELRIEKLWIERGRCIGVMGRAVDPVTRRADKRVKVRARAVVVSAGAVQTPHLLLAHRVGRPSGQLGENFLCHPNAKVLAVYPFDVHAWKGVSQGGQIRQFHDDGIVLAENFVSPGALAAQLPFFGDEAMALMRDYNQMVLTGVLVEDSRAGRVTRSMFGVPLTRYDITDYDLERFVTGITHLATLHFEMGATKVMLPYSHKHIVHSVDELRSVDRADIKAAMLELFTVHLMGTCRMGSDPKQSVVDLTGQLWDLPGCYVADASLFPTAVGVNPQVTIMALALMVAERLQLAD